jgi:hypothetical protein
MSTSVPEPDYVNWRTSPGDREEDAAALFGHYLIKHCRAEALRTVATDAPAQVHEATQRAVDQALHNAMDLFEGFWKLKAGQHHEAELALHVEIRDNGNLVESVRIAPCRVDLPIGYWAWLERYQESTPK